MPHVKYYITCQVLRDSSFQTFMYDKIKKDKNALFHVNHYITGTAQNNVAFKSSSTVATLVTAFKRMYMTHMQSTHAHLSF